MVMPDGISGAELADDCWPTSRDLKIIFTSGYTANEVNAELLAKTKARFLQKPYTHAMLAKTVRDCLDKTDNDPPPWSRHSDAAWKRTRPARSPSPF